MKISKQTYAKFADAHAPRSPIAKNCFCAFLVGGSICTLGQLLHDLFQKLCSLPEETAGTLTSISLIFIAVVLTALGVFDNLAKHAGAGIIVPITGFANSMASPAMEFKSEGYVLGMAAKMFTIAGPVIVYGTVASVIYGIIYWVTTLF